jgi:hypothetical protein
MTSIDHKSCEILPVSPEAQADMPAVRHLPDPLAVDHMTKYDLCKLLLCSDALGRGQFWRVNPPQPNFDIENANRIPVDHLGEPLDIAGMGGEGKE